MSYIEDIQNRRNQVRNNIAKGFGCEFVKAEDDELGEIEKAVYADTPQNRKLGRVGQEYHRGRKKQNIGGNEQKNRKEEGSNNLKQGNTYDKFANYYKFQKNNGVKYPSFAIVREAKSENKGSVIEFTGTKKEFQEAIKKFNSATNSNISIDNFEREHSRGEVRWSATFNPQDGKLYKNDSEIPEQKTPNQAKTKSSKSNSSTTSITTVDDAATFLQKNVDKWSDYQYEELDDEKLEKQFDEANKYIKGFKQFDWKEEDEANAYKEKMEKKGYKIVNLGEGSDTYIFAVLKKSNKK